MIQTETAEQKQFLSGNLLNCFLTLMCQAI